MAVSSGLKLTLLTYLMLELLQFAPAEVGSMAVAARNKTLDAMCSSNQIKSTLEQAAKENQASGDESNTAALELFDTCSNNFLSTHEINPEVKKAVDTWIGFDLSEADVNQILEAYQIALFNEKPADVNGNKKLIKECEQLNKTYKTFKSETLDTLEEYVSTAETAAIGETEEGRSLLSFGLYSQFCSSLYNVNND